MKPTVVPTAIHGAEFSITTFKRSRGGSKRIRPEDFAKVQGPGFKEAVETSKHLVLQGTKDICKKGGVDLVGNFCCTTVDKFMT